MSELIGHDAAIEALREATLARRLHHGWLITGPKGIGKARFARDAARWLLASAAGPFEDRGRFLVDGENRIARLIAAESHPDFKLLERIDRNRSEKGDKPEDRARSITIDQVRALQTTLALSPGLSDRRIVVIDAIDDLERAGANALLKSLEEPPAGTIFLAVSHSPGRLLPTIRSRCRVLRLEPLAEAHVATVMRVELPDAPSDEIDALVTVADGAPGTALRFAGLDVAGLDAAIDRLATHGDPTGALRSALARTLALKAAQPRYELFLERAPSRIAAAARAGQGRAAIQLWSEARRIAEGAVRLSMDPQLTVFELAGLVARLAPA